MNFTKLVFPGTEKLVFWISKPEMKFLQETSQVAKPL